MIPMRRKRQLLSKEENEKILNTATSGVLALRGEDYPYAVPLNFCYLDGKIYFHCAKVGYKLDCMKRDNRVSFCVIGKEEIVPKRFTTYYQSVIVYGRASLVEDEEEKRRVIEFLAGKYSPKETTESRDKEIDRGWNALAIVRIEIEEMTGKQAIELLRV